MIPGTVIARGDRHLIVLASQGKSFAAVPVCFDRDKQRAGDVPVNVGKFGPAIAACASSGIETGDWTNTGFTISAPELRACEIAVRRAVEERTLNRFAPLASFEAAKPLFRSGGRRVGGRAVGA